VDDYRHGMALQLEPQGLLFAEVCLVSQNWKNLIQNLSPYDYS